MGHPGYQKGTGKGFQVDARNWGQNKSLNLVTPPEAYLTWRDRAIGHLAKERADIKKLLLWSEEQKTTIDDAALQVGAKTANVNEPLGQVSSILFESIKAIIHDDLLVRARLCDGNGVELWRKLKSEWEGTSAHVISGKAKRFQDPSRTPQFQSCVTPVRLGSSWVRR
jgi:hypothetical protein